MVVALVRSRLAAASVRSAALSSASFRAASTVRFTKDHEYAKLDGKVATCGISDFAQQALGDVVYVSLPEVGAKFKKGEAMASVESVKAASDVYAPVGGTVKAVNKKVADEPAMVNKSPEGDAWFVQLEVASASEHATLMDEKAYKAHCDASKH